MIWLHHHVTVKSWSGKRLTSDVKFMKKQFLPSKKCSFLSSSYTEDQLLNGLFPKPSELGFSVPSNPIDFESCFEETPHTSYLGYTVLGNIVTHSASELFHNVSKSIRALQEVPEPLSWLDADNVWLSAAYLIHHYEEKGFSKVRLSANAFSAAYVHFSATGSLVCAYHELKHKNGLQHAVWLS